MTGSRVSEKNLQQQLVRGISIAIPSVRIFRRTVVNCVTRKGFRARAGLIGQADCYAYVRGGRVVEIELKAAGGSLSPAQERWQAWCVAWGVPHVLLVARRDESPRETVERWIEEIRGVLP